MTVASLNAWLAGFFALAAVHYAIQWWFSRSERVLLVFSIQCVLYTFFCWPSTALLHATTIAAAQTALDRMVTAALVVHIVLVQFFALVSRRRDRAFRIILTAALAVLALLNQWVPL